MPDALQLHQRGVTALNDGRMGEADRLLRRALSAGGPQDDHDLLARIEASLAYLQAETGARADGLAWCARALARPGLSEVTRGTVLSQRGLLRMLAGENAEALVDLGAAADLLGHDPASVGALGRTLLNRGNVHLQRGDHVAAAADFEAAVSPLSSAGLVIEAAMAGHNRGYCLLLTGELVGALRWMDDARVVLAPLSAVSEATCDQDRAEVLIAAGQVAEGRRALATAARALGSRRLRRRRAEAELVLARTLVLDDPAEALHLARRAARGFAASQAEGWTVRAEAVAHAAEVERGGTGPSLLPRGRDLAAELHRQGLPWGAATVRLRCVRVQVRRGLLVEARADLARVRVGPSAPLAVRLLARDVHAELDAAQGRPDHALRQLRSGLGDLHAWQSSFGSLDLQTMVVGAGTRLGARGLALAVTTERPAVLLEWSERARMLASRVQPLRAPQSPDTLADLAALRELTRTRESTGPREPADTAREAELRQRVRERAWRHGGSGQVADPCSLAELRAGLGSDRALVAYVVTGASVVALVVGASGLRRHDLGDRARLDALLGGLLADLDVAASDLPDALAGFVRAQLVERLAGLAEVLVTPLLTDLGDREVVLTPSGVLAGIPWTLLPGLAGRPVTVAQSATSWLSRTRTPLRTARAGFVAGPRVRRAEDEVVSVARRWAEADVLTGANATAGAVSDLAARVDVLHLAAHGRHSAQNPLFSGVELADGPWFGYDIDQLAAVPDVVLLSACEVGRSSVRWGEELIGMSTAWLHAGARCVIASAAAVGDQAAYDALVGVHECLTAGLDPAAALAQAVSEVTADTAPAPFVCFG